MRKTWEREREREMQKKKEKINVKRFVKQGEIWPKTTSLLKFKTTTKQKAQWINNLQTYLNSQGKECFEKRTDKTNKLLFRGSH